MRRNRIVALLLLVLVLGAVSCQRHRRGMDVPVVNPMCAGYTPDNWFWWWYYECGKDAGGGGGSGAGD